MADSWLALVPTLAVSANRGTRGLTQMNKEVYPLELSLSLFGPYILGAIETNRTGAKQL